MILYQSKIKLQDVCKLYIKPVDPIRIPDGKKNKLHE